MTQFAVYRNPGRNAAVPFVVQIQSHRLRDATGRLVMALNATQGNGPPDHPLTPRLTVQGQVVYANPFNIATVPAVLLNSPLETLVENDQEKIIRALDELVSRA